MILILIIMMFRAFVCEQAASPNALARELRGRRLDLWRGRKHISFLYRVVFFTGPAKKMAKCQITCKCLQKSSKCQNFLRVWHFRGQTSQKNHSIPQVEKCKTTFAEINTVLSECDKLNPESSTSDKLCECYNGNGGDAAKWKEFIAEAKACKVLKSFNDKTTTLHKVRS